MNIFEYFKRKGIDTIDSTFYTKIALWDSWYRANVRRFHQYRVYRGAGSYVQCHRKSLGMGKKVCEDISDLLLNERVKITISNEATSAFVNQVLDDANFAVLGNEYQERKAATGTVAYVPYLTNMVVDDEGRVVSADVKINYVTAANIYPTAWENSRITECVFAFYKTYKRKKYAHLQHHKLEPWTDENGSDLGHQYVIENTVVECSSGAGRELTPDEWNKIPHFSGLAARVETGSNLPQFTIDKLNIVNNADEDSTNPMGVALFANSIDTLEKIDLEYDSYPFSVDAIYDGVKGLLTIGISTVVAPEGRRDNPVFIRRFPGQRFGQVKGPAHTAEVNIIRFQLGRLNVFLCQKKMPAEPGVVLVKQERPFPPFAHIMPPVLPTAVLQQVRRRFFQWSHPQECPCRARSEGGSNGHRCCPASRRG